MLLQYFTDDIPVSKGKFVKNIILIEKNNQVYQVSKEYSKFYSIITKSLETNFGTAKHLFPVVVMTNTMATPYTKT